MSDFVFRNLSVKLFPAEGEAADDCACCSYICQGDSQVACRDPSVVVVCGAANCTNVTQGGCGNQCSNFASCANCSNVPSCVNCSNFSNPACFNCSNMPSFDCICSVLGAEPTKLLPADGGRIGPDPRAGLAEMKRRLRQRLTEVEEQERQLEAAAKPKTVEEIDRVKSHLLAAVAELDEQRAGMEDGPAQPA